MLSFIFPAALWLLLILVPLWALSLSVPRRLAPLRFRLSLLLRTAIILALVLALAGTQVVLPVDHLTTVFLIDASDSISPSTRGQAEAFVQEALDQMPPDDRAAVVVFGSNALVEVAPGSRPQFFRVSSVPVVTRTDIQGAIELGLALFPADTQKRLVLLSDGGENAGRAVEAAQLARMRGVPISYVDLSLPGSDSEALVTSLVAPSSVLEGQEFELVATIESSVEQVARLRIFGDEMLLTEQDVALQPGTNRFSLKMQGQGRGFQRYRAQIDVPVDNREQNNQAEALVNVGGPPRVLLIEGRPGEARNFADALGAANINAEVSAPEAMPADLAGLSDYDAIVLVNVPVQALPIEAVANLPAYVRNLGKGLIMIGGDRSYGIGGYGRTPVEEALPVYMDVRDRQERPDLALVFVIDKSGSMDSCHCSGPNRQTAQFQRGGTPKVDIAKDAVVQASSILHERDTIGVVAFDAGSHWVLPAQQGPSLEVVEAALAPVAPDGSTNVQAGLQAAEEALLNTDARIKHAILLTDGWSGGGDNFAIAERMREQGMTLSVVAAGAGSAEYLEQLAELGGGRYYPVEHMADVPQIFVQETITAVGNYLVEEPFTPSYASPSPVLDGLTAGLPQLYGYNGTTAKETAGVVLTGVDDAPVLAQWQYGLGRSIAWTSDVKGQWAREWVQWPDFARFAAQMVTWVLPNRSIAPVTSRVRTEGSQAIVEVTLSNEAGVLPDAAELQATIVGADGFSQQVPLRQVAPGQYRASIDSPGQGTYLVQVVGVHEGEVVAQDTSGLVVPYSPEYRQGQSNPGLLRQLATMTGGALLERPADAFVHDLGTVARAQEVSLPLVLLALLLLPLDIAVRRLMLRRSDFSLVAVRGALAPPRPSQPTRGDRDSALVDRLHEAKRRARRRDEGQQ